MNFVSIDLLRALACVMIFLYHCNTFLPGEWKFITLFGEDIGNNLFFMISGFTLYRSVMAAPFKDFLPWYGKRLYRILPLLILAYVLSGFSGFYGFSDKAQVFAVFVYPTLYWFVTGILACYPVLFVLGKLVRPPYMLAVSIFLLALALQRSGTLECHYLTGFFAMYAGFCLAGSYNKTSPDGEVLKSLKAATGFPDMKSGAGMLKFHISYWISAIAMTLAYIVAKRYFPGRVSLVFAMLLCIFLVSAFVVTEDGFKAFADKRVKLYGFLKHVGNMALVLYLVQCFNGGLIGFTIGQRVKFPLSFFVNFAVIWSLTCGLYFLDRLLFRRNIGGMRSK